METINNLNAPPVSTVTTVLVGVFFFAINFPTLISSASISAFSDGILTTIVTFPSNAIQSLLAWGIGSEPQIVFETITTYNFFLLFSYIFILACIAFRHLKISIFFYSVLAVLAGYFVFHILFWGGLAIYEIVNFLIIVASFIYKILFAVSTFLLTNLWWIIIPALSWFYAKKHTEKIINKIAFILFIISFCFLIKFGDASNSLEFITTSINITFEFVSNFFTTYITPIFSFMWRYMSPFLKIIGVASLWLLGRLLAAVVFFYILKIIGTFVIDQFRSAFHAASGKKNLILASFSIGSAISIVMLTSSAAVPLEGSMAVGVESGSRFFKNFIGTDFGVNTIFSTGVYVDLMPDFWSDFLNQYMVNYQPPMVDSTLLLVIVVISIFKIANRVIFKMEDSDDFNRITFIPIEIVKTISSAFSTLVLAYSQAKFEGD